MNLDAKLEDQHFVVRKSRVSLRFDNFEQMCQYILTNDEEYQVFVINTGNITDRVKSWKENELNKNTANTNASVA